MQYQRYNDADLVAVAAVTELECSYGGRRLPWPWWAGGGAVVLVGMGVLAWRRVGVRRAPVRAGWKVPEQVTPFTTIALLERIRKDGGLSDAERAEVAATIRDLEQLYFAAGECKGSKSLSEVAQSWVRRAR
jgi:hypothetical protein